MLNPHTLHHSHNIIIFVAALIYVVIKYLYQRKKSSKFNVSNAANKNIDQSKDSTMTEISREQADALLKSAATNKNLKTKIINAILGKFITSARVKIKTASLDKLSDQEKGWLESISPDLKKKIDSMEESQTADLKPAHSEPSTAPITKIHEPDAPLVVKKPTLSTTSTSGSIEIDHSKKQKSIIEV